MIDVEGTLHYMAPEYRCLLGKNIYQVHASNVNLQKVDVYSLGVVAFQMLTYPLQDMYSYIIIYFFLIINKLIYNKTQRNNYY